MAIQRNFPKYFKMETTFYVDGAANNITGDCEYRVLQGDTEIYRSPVYKGGSNNIAEFLAVVHAIAFIKQNNIENATIYTDSQTAIAWVRKRRHNSSVGATYQNKEVFALIERAEQFLSKAGMIPKVIKWNTKERGEIPADYGRK